MLYIEIFQTYFSANDVATFSLFNFFFFSVIEWSFGIVTMFWESTQTHKGRENLAENLQMLTGISDYTESEWEGIPEIT